MTALDATLKNLTAAIATGPAADRATVERCRKVLMAGGSLTPEQTADLAAAMGELGIDAAEFGDEIRTHLARVAEYRQLRAAADAGTDDGFKAEAADAKAAFDDLTARAADAEAKWRDVENRHRTWANVRDKADALALAHPEVAK
jgi:hypothetical protein